MLNNQKKKGWKKMNRDGTGPRGRGPMTGRGMGNCRGRPRRYNQPRLPLNCQVEASLLEHLDRNAKDLGMTRTEYLTMLLNENIK